MDEDRRKFIRYPSFDIKEIFYNTNNSDSKSEKIVLRDESHQGFGAVYVGPTLLNETRHYYFKNSDNSFTAITLVWHRKIAEHVFLLGFEILLNKIFEEVPANN